MYSKQQSNRNLVDIGIFTIIKKRNSFIFGLEFRIVVEILYVKSFFNNIFFSFNVSIIKKVIYFHTFLPPFTPSQTWGAGQLTT